MKNIICGKNSVADAVKNGIQIEKIILAKNTNLNFYFNGKIEFKTIQQMNEITTINHQGIIALIKPYDYKNIGFILNNTPNKILVLDHIQDSTNLGAIMRSANAFGFNTILISNKRSIKVNAAAMKISSGGFVGLDIIRTNSLFSAIKKLKNNGYWIYASSLNQANEIGQTYFNDPMVLIVGNEQKGVGQSLLKLAHERFYIDMVGTVQSLNVSVAAGIIMSWVNKNKN